MPRRREFDPEEVLKTAVDLFWEKGYYDSSVDEIRRRSGVAKYGIYGTLGTKQELFKKVLVQYAGDRHKDIQRPLRIPNASLPDIRRFFREVPKMLSSKGCLICNTGVEMGSRDPEIRDFVKDFFADLTRVMKGCLRRAIEKGQLDARRDIPALAAFLVTEFRTALMLTRSGHSRQDIERHLKVALQVLD